MQYVVWYLMLVLQSFEIKIIRSRLIKNNFILNEFIYVDKYQFRMNNHAGYII